MFMETNKVIDKLIDSGQIELHHLKEFGERFGIGRGGEEKLYMWGGEFRNLVERALLDGGAEISKEFEFVLQTESDGSCDIYYMQYHRDWVYKGEAKVKLSIINENPEINVEYQGEKEWGDWY